VNVNVNVYDNVNKNNIPFIILRRTKIEANVKITIESIYNIISRKEKQYNQRKGKSSISPISILSK